MEFLIPKDFVMNFHSVLNSWGPWISISGCFKTFIDLLILSILLYFSLIFLDFSVINLGFLNRFLNRFCPRNRFNVDSDPKTTSNCNCGLLNFLKYSNPPMISNQKTVTETLNCEKTVSFDQENCDEDKVFDIMSLRKLVKIERQRAVEACLELEKERMAATTAAEEAMAMILRLQNEKSVIELEAQQHKRLSYEKQLHDQEVIQSLRWIVMKHESERSLLEDRLRLCKQRLMLCMNDDGGDDGCEFSLSYLDEKLVSSLELGLSPW